jgi:hypothetical protein
MVPQEVETSNRNVEPSGGGKTVPLPTRTSTLEENKLEEESESTRARNRRQPIPYMKVHQI